jgi:ribonuclease HI
MEMQAAIATLQWLLNHQYNQPVELHTDSEYLKKGITQWLRGWKQKGWKNSAGKPVLNQDLWKQLDDLTQQLKRSASVDITWKYVRGHAGDPGNERCDTIARAFSLKQPIQLQQMPLQPSTAPTERAPEPPHSPESPPVKAATLEFDEEDSRSGNPAMSESEITQANDVSRQQRLRETLETLQIAEAIANQGYLITSAELADLMAVNASAVTSRGDYWAWRNWSVSRIRREGNQILWQLERIDE